MRCAAWILVGGLLALDFSAYGQSKGLEAKLSELRAWDALGTHAPEDTTGLRIMLNLCIYHMMSGDVEQGLAITTRAWHEGIAALDRIHDPRQAAPVVRNLLQVMTMRGEFVGWTEDRLAVIENAKEVLRLARLNNSAWSMISAYEMLSQAFLDVRDLEGALAWSDSVLVLLPGIEDEDKAQSYGRRANVYNQLGRPDSMLHYARLALRYNRAERSLPNRLVALDMLVQSHLLSGSMDSATHYLGLAEVAADSTGNPYERSRFQRLKGVVALFKGDTMTARVAFVRFDSLAVATKDAMMQHTSKRALALIRAMRGDMPGAWTLSIASAQALERAIDPKQVRDLALGQAELIREREQELAGAQLAAKERGRQLAMAGWGGSVVIVLLLAWAIHRGRRDLSRLRGLHGELQRAQGSLLKAENERASAEVRANIARDVHDDLGAELTKVALLSEEARSNDNDEATRKAALETLSLHARRVSSSVRDIIWSTDPELDNAGALVDHLKRTLERMATDHGAVLLFKTEVADRELSLLPQEKRHVLLVAKEAVHNALKHARPKRIDVALRIDGDGFDLRIADDGLGLGDGKGTGHGLANMRRRMELLGGDLAIGAREGGGTEVSAHGRFSTT